jgi:hypothetical protein
MSVTLPGGTVFCTGQDVTFGPITISQDITIDCSQGSAASPASCSEGGDGITINTAGVKVTLRGLTIYGVDPPTCFPTHIGVDITAAALVRIENCKIFGFGTVGVEVAPSSGNVIVKIQDSTITQNSSGVLVAPTGSGSVSISIDRSRIENNIGGGVKTDTSSGAISASISDSSVSFNNGNGLNAVSIPGAQNMLTLVRDVITKKRECWDSGERHERSCARQRLCARQQYGRCDVSCWRRQDTHLWQQQHHRGSRLRLYGNDAVELAVRNGAGRAFGRPRTALFGRH